MDILRKELDAIYKRQYEGPSTALTTDELPKLCSRIKTLTEFSGCAAVVTDISLDKSEFIMGASLRQLNLSDREAATTSIDSSDEDFLYSRLHPEDLVELRMLEYEFFKMIDALPPSRKLDFKAIANIRMKTGEEAYVNIAKATQVAALSPEGKMRLILCCYEFAPDPWVAANPRVMDFADGSVRHLSFHKRRNKILTNREREILTLIQDGMLSKEIAFRLHISTHTVNRHRQNILLKLSVGNSMEAVKAAVSMNLL